MAYTPPGGGSAAFDFQQDGYSPPAAISTVLQGSPGITNAAVVFHGTGSLNPGTGNLIRSGSALFQGTSVFVPKTPAISFRAAGVTTIAAVKTAAGQLNLLGTGTASARGTVQTKTSRGFGSLGFQTITDERTISSVARSKAEETSFSGFGRQFLARGFGAPGKGGAEKSLGVRGFQTSDTARSFAARTQIVFDLDRSLGGAARSKTEAPLTSRGFQGLEQDSPFSAGLARQLADQAKLGSSGRGTTGHPIGTRGFQTLQTDAGLHAEASIFSESNYFYRLISRSLAEQIMDDSDADILVGLLVWLQQDLYERIRDFPQITDVERMDNTFLPYLQKEVATKLPATDLVDVREFIREAKNWYSGKGSLPAYQYIGALSNTLIEVFEPVRLLFQASTPRTLLSGAKLDKIEGGVSQLGRLRDGVYWAAYTYALRIYGSQEVTNEELVELLDLVHPAGTQRFLEFVYQYQIPELSATHGFSDPAETQTDHFFVVPARMSEQTLDGRFLLNNPTSLLDLSLPYGYNLMPAPVVTFEGSSKVQLAGTKVRAAAVSFSGAATLVAVATKTLVFVGNAETSISWVRERPASVVLEGAGTMSLTAVRAAGAQTSFVGLSQLGAAPTKEVAAQIIFSGNATITIAAA